MSVRGRGADEDSRYCAGICGWSPGIATHTFYAQTGAKAEIEARAAAKPQSRRALPTARLAPNPFCDQGARIRVDLAPDAGSAPSRPAVAPPTRSLYGRSV